VALPNRLTTQEESRFFYQLAALLNSGMSVEQSLSLAGKDCNPSFQRYLQTVSTGVCAGQDLAGALALDSRYFDSWTISLIRLAQYSGTLPQTCTQLAIAAEARARRKRLYRSVRLLAIATIWALLILSAAIFNPNSTGLIKPEFWLRSLAIFLLLLAISFWVSRYSSSRSQQLALKLPVLGKLIEANSLLHLAQLRLPLSCGVPILTAVELLREHIPDPVMRANLSSAARQIRIGQSLSYSLQGKLAPIAMQMIRTGEETGNLDTALDNLAQYYEGELERRLTLLQRSLRPLSLLAIAALVAVVGVRGITVLLNSLPD
jgi:type II secretory pathway component PulF